ncbi:MAG: hypothetical protein HY738_23045, partial [Bacteroidia bacterium]|nr:hypothetical protein [Bacteroidia bacterium]
GSSNPYAYIYAQNDGSGPCAQLCFGTRNGVGLLASRMIIASDGNVGIGTDIPDKKLDIAGDIHLTGNIYGGTQANDDALRIYGGNDNTDGAYIALIENSQPNLPGDIHLVAGKGTGEGGKIHFRNVNSQGGIDYNMTITSEGKVGIGTTTPTGKLEIKSNTSAVKFGGNEPGYEHYLTSSKNLIFNARQTTVGSAFSFRKINDYNNLSTSPDIVSIYSDGDISLQVHETTTNNRTIVGGDTTANSIWLVPKLTDWGYNDISRDGDVGIIFRNANQNQGTPPAGLVLAPHRAPGSGEIGIRIAPNGNVGIGTGDPQSRLHIKDGYGALTIESSDGSPYSDITFVNPGGTNRYWDMRCHTENADSYVKYDLQFDGMGLGGDFTIFNAKVGIGMSEPQEALDVKGNIRACKVIVSNPGSGWCDYMFDDDHKRMTPEEKEKYYKENKHLFGIAPGKEIEKNGLDVGSTVAGLTLNVEELSLDYIDLYKMIIELKKENAQMKKEIEELKK